MKLEGWIAIDVNGRDWVADSSKKFVMENMKKQKDEYGLIWSDNSPMPCTITIPQGTKEGDHD